MSTRADRHRPFRDILRDPMAILLILLPLAAAPAAAQSVYVTDHIVADLYAGPQTAGKPLAQLPTGTALQVLARHRGFTRVRTPHNRKGWVSSRLLQAQPPAQVALLILSERQQRTTEELARLRRQLAQYRSRMRNDVRPANAWWMPVALVTALMLGFAVGVMWLDRRLRGRHGGFRV